MKIIMNEHVAAIFLGIVQGATEFLPVSSTGHLIIFEKLLSFDVQAGFAFDIALHAATALAVVLYFRKDWLAIFRSFIRERDRSNEGRTLLLNIILGTIPAGLLGIFFEDIVRDDARTIGVVIMGLLFGSVLIWLAEWAEGMRHARAKERISPLRSFVIGCFQALALMPGISRSGSTISGAMLLGQDRKAATRFSFLLATPIIIGASVKKAIDAFQTLAGNDASLFLAGFASAFVTSIYAIHLLTLISERLTLKPFIYYRLLLAALLSLFML